MNSKKKNKSLTIIFSIIILIVCIMLMGIALVKQMINESNNNESVNDTASDNDDAKDSPKKFIIVDEESKIIRNYENIETNLDVNSNLVQRLYAKVANNGRVYNTNFKYSEQDTSVKDLDYQTKFEMAIALTLPNYNDEWMISCADYNVSSLFSNNTLSKVYDNYYCGGIYNYVYYNTNDKQFDNNSEDKASTTFYYEDAIKSNMKYLFGSNYYVQKDIVEADGIYKYFNGEYSLYNLRGYAFIGNKEELLEKNETDGVISAKRYEDKIIIMEHNVGTHQKEETNYDKYDYYYLFTYNEADNDYYLTHIKSLKV